MGCSERAELGRSDDHTRMHPVFSDRNRERVAAAAHRYGWRLVVVFGSAVSGGQPRDLDMAVLPRDNPDLLTLGRWTRTLEDTLEVEPVDLVVLSDRVSPVLRFEVFGGGICLFEAEPGLFDREQDRAFFLYADSAYFRRRLQEEWRGP